MDATVPGSAPVSKLPVRVLAPFAVASMPVAALGIPLSVYLPNFYASNIGLSLSTVSAAFLAVRLIDIFFDPIIGVTINATNTRFGRFKPWLLAGVPLLMLAGYMIFMAPHGSSKIYLIGWLLVLYAGFSMVTLGHSSWAAAMVPKYHERSRVYGWMQAVGVVAVVIVLAVPVVLSAVWHKTKTQGVQGMGWFIIAITPIMILLTVLGVREPRQIDDSHRITLRDYKIMLMRPSLLRLLASDLALALGPAITGALYIYFFTQVLLFSLNQTSLLLLIYIAAGLVGAPTWAQVAKKLGKHQTVMLACVLYGFAQALVFFAPPRNLAYMVPAMFAAGFIVSCFQFLIRAMIADIGDEVRLEIDKDRTPLLYGLITSTSKVGTAFSVLTFTVLEVFGFDPTEGVMNHGVALQALTGCYVVVPILTMFVGAAALWGYKLDATRHDGIRADLAMRDAQNLAIAGASGVIESLGGPGEILASPGPAGAGE